MPTRKNPAPTMMTRRISKVITLCPGFGARIAPRARKHSMGVWMQPCHNYRNAPDENYMLLRRLLLLTIAAVALVPTQAVFARTAATAKNTAAASSQGGTAQKSKSTLSRTPGDAAGSALDFNALLDRVEASGQVSGLAVAIVKDNEVLLQRGIGYADTSSGAPVTPDTVFRLASLSKAFASALAAMLIDDGVFNWDTRIASVVPSFELID